MDGDYFSTFGIRLLNGRVFNSGDRENTPEVIVINRTMADLLWPGQDPVGKTVLAGDTPRKATVIGVAANGKYDSFDEPARAVMYVALSQHYQPSVIVVARTKGDPRVWIEPLNQAVNGLGIFLPFRPVTFDSWTNFNLLEERLTAYAVAGLSALGVLLAIVGLFGAISYSVSERREGTRYSRRTGSAAGTIAGNGPASDVIDYWGRDGHRNRARRRRHGAASLAILWGERGGMDRARSSHPRDAGCVGAGGLAMCEILDHHRPDGSSTPRMIFRMHRGLLFLVISLVVAGQEQPISFGTTVVVPGGLEGVIYHIRKNSKALPDLSKIKPRGKIYVSTLNVPLRDFTEGFPGVTKREEWFAIDYTGRFWIDKPGLYRFALTSDDGSRLYIDDQIDRG